MHRTIGVMGRTLDQEDGLGVYARNLLLELLRQDAFSRYVIFLKSEKSRHLFQSFGNAEVCLLRAQRKLYWDQVLVPLAAYRYGVDLIFNPKFSIPLLTRRPCIFVQQGSDWYVNPQNYPWWDNLYIRLMLPVYSRRAARMLAISQGTLDDLSRHTRIDVSNIVVSGAGVAPNFSQRPGARQLEQFRQQRELPERFILSIARVRHGADRRQRTYPGANVPRLLRGWQAYRRRGGELPLVLVGAGVEEFLRGAGFDDRDLRDVHLQGFVPNEHMHLFFRTARCFVIATLCESFGIPILEAFTSGCPAIVPNTCAAPEVAGGAARLIDPLDEDDIADALLEVAGSDALCKRLRRRGLERARTLSWEECARRTLRVFDTLVAAPAGDGAHRLETSAG